MGDQLPAVLWLSTVATALGAQGPAETFTGPLFALPHHKGSWPGLSLCTLWSPKLHILAPENTQRQVGMLFHLQRSSQTRVEADQWRESPSASFPELDQPRWL